LRNSTHRPVGSTQALAATESVIGADAKNARAHALKSDILLSRQDRTGARTSLEQAVQADPAYLPARFALVSTLIDDGAHDAARTQLAAIEKAAPNDIRLAYFQSALALRTGDLTTARDRVSQILKAVPDHVPSLVLISKIELQAQQFASSEAHLRRALAQAPDHAEARRLLATSYLQSGQPARARQALQPLLATDDKRGDPALLLLAGETSLASGDVKQAAAYYQRAAASGKKTEAAMAHTRLGQIAMASGRPEEGVRELESAASVDPSFRETDIALVSSHLRNGDLDKALAAAKSLEKKNPKDPMSHQVLGMVYVAKKDLAAARTSFDKALQLNPALVQAARALAELDASEGKTEAARRRYEAMIAKDPGNATLHLALAELQLRSGARPGDVIPTLQNAVRSDPASVDARLALISALARSGNTRGAVSAAQEAATVHPASPQMLQMLATLQSEVGDHNQSVETLRKLAQVQPGVPAPLQRIAAAQAAQKQYDRAAETLRMAKEMAPGDLTVSRDLIVLYLTANRARRRTEGGACRADGGAALVGRMAAGEPGARDAAEVRRRREGVAAGAEDRRGFRPAGGTPARSAAGRRQEGRGGELCADMVRESSEGHHAAHPVGRTRVEREELQRGGNALSGGAGRRCEQRGRPQQPGVDRRPDRRPEGDELRRARGETGAQQRTGPRHDGNAAARERRFRARAWTTSRGPRASRRSAPTSG
jgi:cellulose synthase operon protein C